NEDEESPNESVSSITKVLEWNDVGEATVIEHSTHIHHLTLGDRVGEYVKKCCDGCRLPISASFYYCTQCDYFLHKICVELPKVKHVWHHLCRPPLVLTSNKVFVCEQCRCWSNAFAYKCEECEQCTCIRCIIALTPGAHTCLGHKHPLLFYPEYKGRCVACGEDDIKGLFRCKDCNFSLDHKCFSLLLHPNTKMINIFFHSLMVMIIVIQKAIFVMYVKKVEIQIFGFIIVQHAILLLMSIVSLVDIYSSNSGVLLKYIRTFMNILSLLLRRLITIQTVVSVVASW
ncbi:hypothetical protein Godav_026018, partial [Gossypium davidsonii]|nr:hypothetical protein [Gossypium davidsonii]